MAESKTDPNAEKVDVTEEQWQLFCSTVHLWWERLGLHHAGITLLLVRDELDCQGKTVANTNSRQVTIYQSTKLQRCDATDEGIRATALHEVCHAFMFPISWLAWDRTVTHDQLDAGDHEVTRRLEAIFSRALS